MSSRNDGEVARVVGDPRLLAYALVASAVALVAQTIVFKLVPYDDDKGLALAALALRCAFFAVDVLVLVGATSIARSRAQRPYALGAAAIAAFSVLSGLLGLASRASPSGSVVASLAASAGAAEPATAFVSTFGFVLLLASLAREGEMRRTWTFVVVLLVGLVAASGFKLARVLDPASRTPTLAWLAWIIEVSRPAVLGAFALAASRALRAQARRRLAGDLAGPYRGAAREVREGATAADGSPAVVPEPAQVPVWRAAATNAGRLTLWFAVRIGVGAASTLLGVAVLGVGPRDLAVVLVLPPIVTFALDNVMLVTVARAMPLARMGRASGRFVVALVMIAFGAVAELVVLVTSLVNLDHGWRLARTVSEMWPIEMTARLFTGGVALVLLASGVGAVGRALRDEAVARRAKGVESLAVVCAASFVGAVAAFLSLNERMGEPAWGGAIVTLLFLVMLGTLVAVLVTTLLLFRATRRTLAERADAAERTSRTMSPPGESVVLPG